MNMKGIKVHDKHFAIIFLLFLGICFRLNAQDNTNYKAKDYMKIQDYNRALVEYLKLYKTNSEDLDLNLNIGICYLNINDDKSKAFDYLKKVYNAGGYKNELLLNMGLALMHANKFDEAIRFFNDYRIATNNKNDEEVD